jgi:AraC family transcriptional regulator of adaptative response/methylated-DNA-[protein]-cysteine methyltransferase
VLIFAKFAPMYTLTRIQTPLGEMIAGATDRGVCLLAWPDGRHFDAHLRALRKTLGQPVEDDAGDNPHLRNLRAVLEEYFDGRRREFDLPLDPVGTAFQKRAWQALAQVPYGTTTSYAAQAAALGHPRAVRATAGANARNRISIILPCHRILGSNGTLTGYAGGIERKKALLALENDGNINEVTMTNR